MKSLQESLLSDEDILMQDTNGDKLVKSQIKKFIKTYYICSMTVKIIKNENGKFIVNTTGRVSVDLNQGNKLISLTNDMFEWGVVEGSFRCVFCKNLTSLKGAPKKCDSFDCSYCSKLTSLEYAPEKVDLSFDCSSCKNLTSLEGAPKKCDSFDCSYCDKLKTLEGAPEKINRNFDCSSCKNLISLEGAPNKIGGNFNCNCCNNLKSLEGAPKNVGRDFKCIDCGTKFTEEYIRKYSNVKGKIENKN